MMFKPGDIVRGRVSDKTFVVVEDQNLSSWGDMAPSLINVIDETNGCIFPIFISDAVLVTPAPKTTAPVGEKFNLYWNSDGEPYHLDNLDEEEVVILVKTVLRGAGEITGIINVKED